MARYIPPHPKKGSAEAKAWGKRMQALRRRRKLTGNPGAAWHETEAMSAAEQAARVTPGSRAASFFIGKRAAHTESAIESGARGMNPKAFPKTFLFKREGLPSDILAKDRRWSLYDAFPTQALALQNRRDFEASQLGEAIVADGGSQAGRLRYGLYVSEKRNPKRPRLIIPEAQEYRELYQLALKELGDPKRAKQAVEMYYRGFLQGQAIRSRRKSGNNPRRPHGTFRSCVRQVKKSLKHYDRTGDPKKICGAALSKKNVDDSNIVHVTRPKARQNPCGKNPIAIYNKPRVIYGKCLALYAQKTSGQYAGQRFKHTFNNPVVVIGNPDGSVLLKSTVGKKLWGA